MGNFGEERRRTASVYTGCPVVWCGRLGPLPASAYAPPPATPSPDISAPSKYQPSVQLRQGSQPTSNADSRCGRQAFEDIG